jgi:hypothetical protein
MRKREFEALKKRIVKAFNAADPNYDALMDEATQACSDEQWENITDTLDALREQHANAD